MYSLPAHPPRICKRKVWEGGLLSWQMSASTSRPEWRGWAGKGKLPSLAEGLLRGEATNGACGLAENRNINSGTPNSHKVSLARNNEDDRQRPSCRAPRLPVVAVNIINSNNSSYYLMSPSSGPAAELSASQTLTPSGREALLSHFSDGKFQEMV